MAFVFGDQSARGRWSRVICRGRQGPSQNLEDLVGNFNFYLKSKGKPLEDLNWGVTQG